MMIRIINEDNMDLMSRYEDNHFELAIVDPPYGIGFSDYERGASGKKTKDRYTNKGKKKWDSCVPKVEYFNEVRRVSIHQIIWGGNYFFDILGNCKHFIFWYKKNPVSNFADGELAWTNINKPAACFEYMYYGNINSEKNNRIHPTQKPVKLYEWLLMNYAKEGDKILDTHLGSGSIAIACHNLKFDLTACELDKDYYEAAVQRLKIHQMQQTLF